MIIDTAQIQELRNLTGAGIMDCKRALEASGGDFARAKAHLNDKAGKTAQKKADREVGYGVVEAYIHGQGRIGVLIEVRCETDFLAGSVEFRGLVKELALQIAAESPQYISTGDVPPEAVDKIAVEAEENATALGKPPKAVQQIKEGKVRKFLSQVCLLEQPSIKDPEVTIGELIRRLIAKCGENIQVRQFTRYQLPK